MPKRLFLSFDLLGLFLGFSSFVLNSCWFVDSLDEEIYFPSLLLTNLIYENAYIFTIHFLPIFRTNGWISHESTSWVLWSNKYAFHN